MGRTLRRLRRLRVLPTGQDLCRYTGQDDCRRPRWLSTAWDLANLYLAGVGAERLAADAPKLVGLSEGTTCYLSPEYFKAPGRFDDFLVHEAAHIFHNCKRRTIGLRETRRREWLLKIEFARREAFAYACETYSRIHELG